MTPKHLVALLQEGYTTIEVSFNDRIDQSTSAYKQVQHGRTYTYKAPLSAKLAEGDQVIVDSPSKGMTVVDVVRVHTTPKIDINAPFTYKWIVQKVDSKRYFERMEEERRFAELLEEIERVRQRDQLVEQYKERMPKGSEARALFDGLVANMARGLAEDKSDD